MRECRARLFFFLRRGILTVRGFILFGPVRASRGETSVRMTLDAFEHSYGRLPQGDEQTRLVQKLSWFDQQVPSPSHARRDCPTRAAAGSLLTKERPPLHPPVRTPGEAFGKGASKHVTRGVGASLYEPGMPRSPGCV